MGRDQRHPETALSGDSGPATSPDTACSRIRVIVSGRVQGVWFRASTQQMAQQLGIAGWVRNRPNSSVEAAFEGDTTAVLAAVEWCHDGPDFARVDDVETFAEQPEGLVGFEIRD